MVSIGSEDTWQIDERNLRIFKALLTDSKLANEFVSSQRSDLFFGDSADIGKIIYNYVKSYRNVPTARVLIQENADNDLLRDKITSIYEVLPDIEFDPKEYQYEVEKLKERYIEAKVAGLQNEFRYGNLDNAAHSITEMERALKDIKEISNQNNKAYIQKSIKNYLPEFKRDYVSRLKDPNLGQGIKTGYSYIDYVTNGIRLGELVIIGAETSAGKSMFLNNIALQMWLQNNTIATSPKDFTKGCNVLYFSLEMPYESCFRRTMARLADVPMYGLRDSTLTRAEADSVSQASRFISKYPFELEIVDIPRGVSIETIEEHYLEAKTRYTPDVVMVDYLGLMEDQNGEGDDWLRLGNIAGKLHEFGRANNTRVVTAVQLNRLSNGKKTHEQHEIIGVHRFGRSSMIAHHANICIQIESRPDEHLRSDLVYHLIKNRDGEKGSHTIQKKFANGAIYDVPYVVPGRDEYGSLVSGFGDDDISDQVSKILGIK